MENTISQWVNALASEMDRVALRPMFVAIAHCLSTQSLTTAGLAIKTGGSAIVKTGAAAYYGLAKGILVTVAASTDMPALVGSVANGAYNVFAFFINSEGVVTSQIGTPGSTLSRVRFPAIPGANAILGFVIIHPTGTGAFVGGTTALDDATVVPNAVYISTLGQFDPTVLVENRAI